MTYNYRTIVVGLIVAAIVCFGCANSTDQKDNEPQKTNQLTYEKPAEKWVEALPLGNGRLGAMVYGTVEKEHIQFNEETLWLGEPHDYAHKGANKHLGEIRKLLTEGRSKEAHKLAQDEFMSVPLKQKHYQPFGDLYLEFEGHENYTNYNRSLNLNQASTTVSYTVGEVNYTREMIISHPDQVLAAHLKASESKALEFNVWLDAIHDSTSVITTDNEQTLHVQVNDGVLRGVASFKIKTDGQLSLGEADKVNVENATWATIYLTAGTNYVNYNDVSGNPDRSVTNTLSAVSDVSYEEVKKRHTQDYTSLYNRFTIDLGDNERSTHTTDKRIYEFWGEPNDPGLVALYVQYARYLLLSSSRQGTKPATLQGIWNDKIKPPWFSSYTTNINLEMNYWPVEMTNLSECHEPLFGLLEDLSVTGQSVAREHYNVDGWIAHHNIDIWRGSAPVNASHHGIWQGGGAWMTSHIWEHYLFTQDKEFLSKYYPILRESALFYSQVLYKDPNTGYLISSPSNSPEIGGLVAGPTMDHQLIRACFRSVIAASSILNKDIDFANELESLIPQIAPNQIGKHGQLQEWIEDKDDPESHHRHVSHLWAVHPGNEINWEDTPDLMKAAQQSLEYRGDNGTGWSLAWKINFWSRFRNGNRAYTLLHRLLSPAQVPERKIRGGSYPNLFDAHPPFQIDGNFGGAAGILEMIVQSHLDKIELLPALPDALPQGKITGLRARGGFEIDMVWEESKLTSVKITSLAGMPCTLTYGDKTINFESEIGQSYSFNGQLEN